MLNSETINFLADPSEASSSTNPNHGFKVRYDKEKGLLSVIDLGQGMTGMSNDQCGKYIRRILVERPEFKLEKYNFIIGQNVRTRKTWACNVDTAIELCQLWPGKAAAEFRRACAVTIRKVLAGDQELIEQMQINQQRTDPFTELMRARNNQEWIEARKNEKETRKVTRDLMKIKLVKATPKDYAMSANIINKSVLLFPDKNTSQMKKRMGIPKRTPSSEFKSKSQLALDMYMNATKGEYLESKSNKSVTNTDMIRFLELEGKLIKPLAKRSYVNRLIKY